MARKAEVGGEGGVPIRYAGDEFIILLPTAEKQAALEMGERLVELSHERPVHLKATEDEFPLTLRIGFSTPSVDALGDLTRCV